MSNSFIKEVRQKLIARNDYCNVPIVVPSRDADGHGSDITRDCDQLGNTEPS